MGVYVYYITIANDAFHSLRKQNPYRIMKKPDRKRNPSCFIHATNLIFYRGFHIELGNFKGFNNS